MTESLDQDMSPQINELAAALSKAQGMITAEIIDAANPFFKSKYADLASVWDAARKPLSSNGLSIVQTTSGDQEIVTIVTTLLHSSGQWIRGKLQMKPVKNDPQGIGSCITYARRYALSAMVGIAPEDDDAEAATGRKAEPKVDKITDDQVFILSEMLEESGITAEEFCKTSKIKTLSELSAARFEGAKAFLSKAKKGVAA